MCPGGWIVPAATENDEVVVNGMSLSRRDSPFANSGMVATVEPEDLRHHQGTRRARRHRLPEKLERAAKQAGGGGQVAPGQRVTDFLAARISADLPETSYFPGIPARPAPRTAARWITSRMREGLRSSTAKCRGYASPDALLLGFETRTSSPVRIPRRDDTLQHPEIAASSPAARARLRRRHRQRRPRRPVRQVSHPPAHLEPARQIHHGVAESHTLHPPLEPHFPDHGLRCHLVSDLLRPA
jgi:uncharacterized protein